MISEGNGAHYGELVNILQKSYIYEALALCQMPTILRHKVYRFFFYANDHTPMHIHVEKGDGTVKFNLEPIELVKSKRFNAAEINEIRKLVIENLELFKNKWDEYFNKL